MKIDKANRNAVRSSDRVERLTTLSRQDLRRALGVAQSVAASTEVCWWISWWFENGERVEEFNYHVGYPQDG